METLVVSTRLGERTARGRGEAICRSRLSDDAAGRLALHEHRADRRREVRAGASGLVRAGARRWSSSVSTCPGAVRLAIVNGQFAAGLSDLSALPKGIRIAGLRDGARDGTDGLEEHLGKVFNIDAHPFAALNTSLLDDGVAIFVTAGAVVETPIHIVVVTGGDGKAVAAHPRVLIVAGANSQVRVAQTFIGTPGAEYFNNAVAEVVVGEGAIVDAVYRSA